MKFLCDVHISYKICKFLENEGHSAIHVNSILDKWLTKDGAICEYADKNGLIVLTKDEDFRASFILKRKPKKLLRVVLGNISNQKLIDILDKSLNLIEKIDLNESFFVEIGIELSVFYPTEF
jgi:predicted nuclease of predicted toxin-antitoxin system